jgi:hypothetical protein
MPGSAAWPEPKGRDMASANKHLFILCPPSSGSTLLWRLLQTSPRVSAFPAEGQTLVKDVLFISDRWNPGLKIPWDQVREKWRAAWDLSKPVLLEKSPPHLVRARQLEENFPDSHFVIMIRNPYAFCEGIRRRWRKDMDYAALARLWVDWAGRQVANCHELRHGLFFTYEELCRDPQGACRRLLRFLPELEELHPEMNFRVFEKNQNVEDLNSRQIARLDVEDIREINRVLKGQPGLLARFGYGFLGDAGA